MTEDEFITRYLKPLSDPSASSVDTAKGQSGDALQFNDDAAILTPPPGTDLILSKDLLIEGTHFLKQDDPTDIAIKSLAVNLSDIAAKGAEPLGFMLGLAFPAAPAADWATKFTSGLATMIKRHNCPLLGGDTTRGADALTISITIFGKVATGSMVRRSTARAGDLIFTSGTLGDAALGLMLRQNDKRCDDWQLTAAARDYLIGRYLRPTPRLNLAAMLARYATAVMDLSDGVIKDLPKLCRASQCTASISLPSIPWSDAAQAALKADSGQQTPGNLHHQALAWGDDYELLFTIDPKNEIATRAAAEAAGTPVHKIGTITRTRQERSADPVTFLDENDRPVTVTATGYDHF